MQQSRSYKPLALITLAAASLAIGSQCASAAADPPLQSYYHAGAWDAFSGRNANGGAVCGVGTTNPADHRRLSIRFDIGGANRMFSATKPGWSIPDNTPIPVVMQLGLNTPWTEQATGHANSIDWSIDPAATQTFDQQFRAAPSMTLTFPDGNEPPWTISLAGSSAISATFSRCVTDLTRQTQALRPPPNSAPSQANPPATQPFSPPAATASPDAAPPPDTAPPAAAPTDTQPGVPPPAH
ncbi:hypothetical protein [Rhodopila sp.]|uniref:hypothetical protein n=1 Tax=Rhodopila sp. TaxID=2480087 RepID=UPI003D0C5AEF